ncbi:MAG: GerMN domain-containing protein [Acidimicrobiales bacterium]
MSKPWSRRIQASRSHRLAIAAAVLAAATALCSCGIPIETSARALPQGQLPHVLSQAPQTTTTTQLRSQRTTPVTIFFVLSGFLHPVVSNVRSPPTFPELLQSLENGPDVYQEGERIETDLPVSSHLRWIPPSSHAKVITTVNIELDSLYFNQTGPPVELELAQIVYTLTSNNLDGAKYVQFWFNGNKQDVELGNSALTPGAVGQCDYTIQLPASSPQPKCGGQDSSTGPKLPNG